ncbi:MAG TPA: cytochrome P450 [Tepidisphaeraceae bacterium]|nr:cytochrome P450 [Tepidisphaeraceae bacterium]
MLAPGPRPFFSFANYLRMRRDITGFFAEVHRQFGDVVSFKVGPRRIWLLSHPDVIRDVLVTRADNFTKGPALKMAKITLGEGLLTSEGDFHKRQRRMIQPAFHARRVAEYADTIVKFGERAADSFRTGQPFDVRDAMTRVTLEIVAKALFDAEIAEEVDEIGHAMDITVRMFDRSRTPLAPLLNLLPLPSNFRFLSARNRVFATLDRMIADRRARPDEERRDFLSILLRARDESAEGDGSGMDDEQVRFEAMTLFSAGHETTANALVWTWLLLAQNPEAQAKLHGELDRVLAGRTPTATDAEALPYTRAVIAESMRLYPPAWVLGRANVGEYPVPGTDYTIPPENVILMSQHLVHRDPRWWPRAESFDPGRWLAGDDATRPRYAYFPFGGGPRQCVGESLAWLEGILLLATFARRWRLERADEAPIRLHPTITLRPRDPLMMRAVKR